MATNKNAKSDFQLQQRKETSFLEYQVNVNEKTSTLAVKMDFDNKDGNYKITTSVVTKQVDPVNWKKTEGLVDTLSQMILEAAESMAQRRKEWLGDQNPEDPDQLGLGLTGTSGSSATD